VARHRTIFSIISALVLVGTSLVLGCAYPISPDRVIITDVIPSTDSVTIHFRGPMASALCLSRMEYRKIGTTVMIFLYHELLSMRREDNGEFSSMIISLTEDCSRIVLSDGHRERELWQRHRAHDIH